MAAQEKGCIYAMGCIIRGNQGTNLFTDDSGIIEGARLPDNAPEGADVLYPEDTLFDDVPTEMLAEGDP